MQCGYSLIEVLVAMAVFAIASLGLAAGVTTVIRAGAVSEQVTQATVLAQEKMAEFRAAMASTVMTTAAMGQAVSSCPQVWPSQPQIRAAM